MVISCALVAPMLLEAAIDHPQLPLAELPYPDDLPALKNRPSHSQMEKQ